MGTTTLKPRAAAPRAPMPAPPVRQFSFTDFQVANPTAPPPGDRLDAEFDRANTAIDSTITWASTSLNTDGSIRDGAIGQNQLVSGLFDDVAQGIIDEVQPLVDDAQGFANAAQASSTTAQAAATSASTSNVAAQGAADSATAAASSASQASTSAQDYAFQAGTAAGTAQNADNHATGEAAWASNYAVLAEAWAEHMPDPIPPNILATMGITGDHWSSRWWATKAEAAFGGLTTTMYLGAWPTPPTSTPTGDPITVGAIYYNTTSQQPFVWNGSAWVPFYAPTKALLLTLLYRASANQTVFALTTPDLGGQTYGISPATPEPVEVYVNGIRTPQDDPNPGNGDWTLNNATSTVTFLRPLLAGSMVQVDVMTPASALAPTRVQTQPVANIDLDPATGNPGQIDGVRTTFPLIFTDGAHTPVNPGSAQEMFISLDGVVQQPNISFTVSAGNIVFTEPPALAAVFWGYWYGPGLSGTGPGAGFLPISGGTLTGPLTLAGPPSLPLNAATKAYVDSLSGGGPFVPVAGNVTMTGPLNYTATGGSASRSAQDRAGQTIDIRDLGAACNGVTDDTAAWTAAFAKPNGTVIRVPQNCVSMVGGGGSFAGFAAGGARAVSIIGEGRGSVIRMMPGTTLTNSLFAWNGGAANVRVEHLTIDCNNCPQPAATQIILSLSQVTTSAVRNVSIINGMLGIYMVGFWNATDFWVENCCLQATAASNSVQQKGIVTFAALGASLRGRIVGNTCINNNTNFVAASQMYISGNDISGWGIGAGVATDPNATRNAIIGNRLHDSMPTQDTFGDACSGVENWSSLTLIEGNQCWNNAGGGIFSAGPNCAIIGNACWDNNAYTTLANAGIAVGASSPTFASGSVILANECFDSGVGRQAYGFKVSNSGITGLKLDGNKFSGTVADTLLSGATFINNTDYTPRILSGDPTTALGAATMQYVQNRGVGNRLLYQTTTSVGNGADTTADVLQTYSVPANTLVNIGDRVIVRAAGTFASSTDSKTVRLLWGGGVTFTLTVTTASQQVWFAELQIIKTAAGVQTQTGFINSNSNSCSTTVQSVSRPDTAPIVASVTGQNSTTATAGTITCAYFTVDYLAGA